jgi:hypothetical protein
MLAWVAGLEFSMPLHVPGGNAPPEHRAAVVEAEVVGPEPLYSLGATTTLAVLVGSAENGY